MIIVFGASGLLGSTVCNLLKLKKKEYIGFSRSKPGL